MNKHPNPARPTRKFPVRELLIGVGINVSDWAFNQKGVLLKNPNDNIYRNSQWAFGGGEEPMALCIWFDSIQWDRQPATYTGSQKRYQEQLNILAGGAIGPGERQRLRTKVNRSQAFGRAVREAFIKRLPIRAILVEGRQAEVEDAAVESSTTRARELDPISWFAHDYDSYTGTFKLVRGVEAPPVAIKDPFADIVDPADDPVFQRYVQSLSETERDALIKIRVGQGPFRDALIARWKGCAVLGCTQLELLVAGHIKPWSFCETAAERLGHANGLLLSPNFDKMFDRGLISFDDKYRIVLSPRLSSGTRLLLNIDKNVRLRTEAAGADLLPFLEWHRKYVFHATID